MRRVVFVVAVLLGALVTPGTSGVPGTATPTANAAASDIIALVVEGTGFGHGRGMSQWGAYGWAVDQGWSWQQILDHYYGGTTLGDVPAGRTRITVRLLAFDGSSVVGVTSGTGNVTAGGVTARSLYAKEIANNQFEIWSTTTAACPGALGLQVPNGPLQRGATGDPVRQIQTFLNAFRASTDAVLAVDGQFGPATESRLRGWQTTQGLPANGIWDTDDATRARQQVGGGTATWTKRATVVGPVTFTSANGDTSSAAPSAVLGACDAGGRVTHYRGKLVFHNATSNTNWLVNDVKTEDYLRGVVPKEVSANWANAGSGRGANAVRAQAVAARSYGLAQNRYAPYASTCDSMSCQVYGGSATRPTATGTATSVEHALSDAAITATLNKVRLRNGAVVSTEFSASNGPRTAGYTFPAVDDTLGDRTANNPNHRWTRVIDADAIRVKYGLSSVTSAAMVEAASATNKNYDGIWFNDLLLNGSRRIEAWTFRGDFSLPSPGFTVRVVTRDTTTKTFAMIGDSVGNSVAGSPTSELATLIDGTFASATLNMRDGRCVAHLCNGTGSNGAQIASTLPANLDLVVVELGYNQVSSAGFPADVDSMMRALVARGTKQVAWVNLATAPGIAPHAATYAQRNTQLAQAVARWPQLTILDWDTASKTAERSRWFSDHAHLTATGQAKFAVWLRTQIGTLAPPGPAPYRLTPQRRLEIPVVGQTVEAPDGTSTKVPANATAVMLNATAVTPSGSGYFALWPCGGTRPVASSLNFAPGEIVSNGIVAPIGANGKVCLYTHATSDVVVDITGWIANDPTSDAQYTSVIPERLADSRDGTGIARARLAAGQSVAIQVSGRQVTLPDGTKTTVPTTASAAAINVIAIESSAAGFLTVWPCGSPLPVASTLNYRAGEIRANGSIVSVGSGGQICVYAHQTTDIVMDLTGWFTGAPSATGTGFVSAVPDRWVDTRIGLGAPKAKVQRNTPLVIPVVGRQLTVGSNTVAIPANVNAVAVNVVAEGPVQPGFTTLWSCDGTVPTTSNVNYAAHTITANNAVVPVGTGGSICLHVHTATDIVVDVTGWFNDGSLFTAAGPDRLVDSRVPVGPRPI